MSLCQTQHVSSGILTGFRTKNTLLEGWLTKMKGSSDKWDRKYFILYTDKLLYMSPRIKGNFRIIGCKVTLGPVPTKGTTDEKVHVGINMLDLLSLFSLILHLLSALLL